MIALDVNWWDVLQFLVTVLLPLLVGLVTKRETPGVRKGVLLAFLAVLVNVGGALLAWQQAGSPGVFDLADALFTAMTGFVFAVAAQFGIYAAKDSSGVSLTDRVQARGVTGKHRASGPAV
jgi:hypothetical protein